MWETLAETALFCGSGPAAVQAHVLLPERGKLSYMSAVFFL